MALNRKAKSYPIVCPTCQEERFVAYAQNWNIQKGNSSGNCPKCKKGINTEGLELGRGWNKGIKGKDSHSYGRQHFTPTGEDNPFYGRKHTQSTKKVMRDKKMGRYGALANGWKGGKTAERNILMARDDYQQLREKVFERDNYTCQECTDRGGKLSIHHIKSWRNYPELRYEKTNLITLCIQCHKQTDNFASSAFKEVVCLSA